MTPEWCGVCARPTHHETFRQNGFAFHVCQVCGDGYAIQPPTPPEAA